MIAYGGISGKASICAKAPGGSAGGFSANGSIGIGMKQIEALRKSHHLRREHFMSHVGAPIEQMPPIGGPGGIPQVGVPQK